jgi:DNA repair protein RadC
MPADLDAGVVHPNGHRRIDPAGRPRERLLQYGAHTLTDAELVSLLLSAGANTVQVAQRLLETVGGVPGLARWHPEALCRLPGLGEVTAARVRAVRAVADGTTDACLMSVRDIVTTVLRHEGHAFGIAHNHPSGDPTPSRHDRDTTAHCQAAAEATGLNFLGHLVLGEHDSWESA